MIMMYVDPARAGTDSDEPFGTFAREYIKLKNVYFSKFNL